MPNEQEKEQNIVQEDNQNEIPELDVDEEV